MNTKEILDDIRRNAEKVARKAATLMSDRRYASFLDDQEDTFRSLRDDMEQASVEIDSSLALIAAQAK